MSLGPIGWVTAQDERLYLTERFSRPTFDPLQCKQAAAKFALARGKLFKLWTHDYEKQKRKTDEITKDADNSLVPVIVAIVIGWLLLVSLACLIIPKISDVTPVSGAP